MARKRSHKPKTIQQRTSYNKGIGEYSPDSTAAGEYLDFEESDKIKLIPEQTTLPPGTVNRSTGSTPRNFCNNPWVIALYVLFVTGAVIVAAVMNEDVSDLENEFNIMKTEQQEQFDDVYIYIDDEVENKNQQISNVNQILDDIEDSIQEINLQLNELFIRLQFIDGYLPDE
ncbi:MAG: hypothetical protein H0S79_11965 [Anaerolineaceae bacterium]|nr:hypothetical protein [Anaerolineaceae bacterium]